MFLASRETHVAPLGFISCTARQSEAVHDISRTPTSRNSRPRPSVGPIHAQNTRSSAAKPSSGRGECSEPDMFNNLCDSQRRHLDQVGPGSFDCGFRIQKLRKHCVVRECPTGRKLYGAFWLANPTPNPKKHVQSSCFVGS